jgi:hypothetical protein
MNLKRKKYLSILMALTVSASMLAGCGNHTSAVDEAASGSSAAAEGTSSLSESLSEKSRSDSSAEDVLTDSGALSSISVDSSSVEQAAEENSFDNRTDLADGDYKPDEFSWSGGSGRVEISCNGLTVKNGRSYADIQFSSTHYIYVRAGGLKINGSGSFRIPVSLNQNNTVIGCTTAMSTPHEITYTMYFGIKDAGGTGTGQESSSGLSAQYDSLDETAPQISGLEYKSEISPEHAGLFRIFRYDHDVDLVEVVLRDTASGEKTAGSASGSTAASSGSTAESGSNLYENNVIKYLIVPKDTELVAGIEKEAVVITKPAEKVFVASDSAEKLLQDGQLTSAFEQTEAGSYDDWDLKTLLKSDTDLIIEDGRILSADQKETFGKNVNSSIQMNIPMFIDRSEDESSEEAKAEWGQIYRLIFS